MDTAAPAEFRSQIFAAQVRKLLVDAHLLRERSVDLYDQAGLIVRRNKARVAQTRRRIKLQEQRRAERLLRKTIFRKLGTGLLPETGAPIVYGAPGAGGLCDACEHLLRPTQLVMSVPFKEAFVYLHADCFTIWNALRQSPARLN